MKLIVVLSVIAFGYAAKLDRTYLPPSSAATAGGSPGAITAPDSGFGLGPESAELGKDLPNGPASRPSFGPPISNVPTGQGTNQVSGFPGSQPSFGQPGNQGSNQAGFPGTKSFKDNEIGNDDSSRPTSQFGSQESRTPFGQAQDFTQEEPRPERPQAADDRNAEILKNVNENNGDSYEYSYETSNGISAGESGVATNGVMAQGGFSYTGDDGKPYSITYTADENGFQPQGEHLPTPHPIPEEILKSIEDNARAAASGTQEGAYRPEEYESESSLQQNGNGAQRPSQQGPIFTGTSSQRKPDQGFGSFPESQQASQNQYPQGTVNDYPETSGQQRASQQPFGNAYDIPQGQRPGSDGYNYNRPTQGQDQQRPSQRPSQAFGNKGDNEISGPPGRPNQFNQIQRSQPGRQPQGLNNQFDNQGIPIQYSPQQNSQTQGENSYNYNRPQTISSGSQSSSQGDQPQKPVFGFGNNNQDLSAQPQGARPNANQQRPQFSQNQFGSQPQKYSPSQTGQNQRENGYTYSQPQNPQNSAQGPQGSQNPRFPGSKQNIKNVFGQQSNQLSRDVNQAQRPTSDSNNAFGRPQGSSSQYSQGPRGQDQEGNGYNYNQPQKSGTQPGQSPIFSQVMPSQSGPQARPNNQFGQPQRPTQGPFTGNQQGPSNKFPSGQRGQDQDENGYYYNRPQNTQTQGPFGQRPQSGAPNQSGLSPRPISSFDYNNEGARSGPMKPTFGQNRPEPNADRKQYSPENKHFGSSQSDSRPLGGSDSSRPSEKFQPSLAPASQFRPQQPSQTRPIPSGPSGQDAPNQSQSRPSFFGPSTGNTSSQSQNRPSALGQSSQNGDQTLAQGYQYGPGPSNQPQRPGSNGQGNGTPAANKGPGSEFGGPRQLPSFSPEEGYKY